MTDEQIRAELQKHVTAATLPDMTKRILRRKIEDALRLQSGCLDHHDRLADRTRITKLLQEHLDSIKNATGQDTSRGSTKLRAKPSQGTMDGETAQLTPRQQQCSAVNATYRHPIMTCVSHTHFECDVCKWWHKKQKACTRENAPEFHLNLSMRAQACTFAQCICTYVCRILARNTMAKLPYGKRNWARVATHLFPTLHKLQPTHEKLWRHT